ncbi:hypothetical protein BIFDEN_01430 [Bifidobacterium dentium ATCC 27678]|nr:hypothetical protein BIFDEN_01430 [Bifidobacterium dentium ATCC 27678]
MNPIHDVRRAPSYLFQSLDYPVGIPMSTVPKTRALRAHV